MDTVLDKIDCCRKIHSSEIRSFSTVSVNSCRSGKASEAAAPMTIAVEPASFGSSTLAAAVHGQDYNRQLGAMRRHRLAQSEKTL
jgi:hypothetical protein